MTEVTQQKVSVWDFFVTYDWSDLLLDLVKKSITYVLMVF